MFTKRKVSILFIVVAILHLGLIVYFGAQKSGFHEDEYFSYWSAAGNSALQYNNSTQWTTGRDLLLHYTVSSMNRFNYKAVVYNQAMDVHPPLYYIALNILMSLKPDSFTKWFGISLNALFSMISLAGITFLFYRMNGKDHWIRALAASLIYAISPAVLSNVMFARMYAMFTMWNVLYTCVLFEVMHNTAESKRRFAILTLFGSIICYFSFLTHYFCLFLPFCLTVGYVIYTLITRKGFLKLLIYGVSMLAAVGLAVYTFPTSLYHIFSGYRGTGAIDGLIHYSLWDKIVLFYPILNKNFFGGLLIPILVIVILALLWISIRRSEPKIVFFEWAMLVSCLVSGAVLTKTSLYFSDASACRYFYAVGSLLLPLSFVIMLQFVDTFFRDEKKKKSIKIILTLLVFGLNLAPQTVRLFNNGVYFLYPEEKQNIEFSVKNKDYPVILVYGSGEGYRSEYRICQIWPYSDVLLAEAGSFRNCFDDEKLREAGKIIVHVDAPEDYMQELVDSIPYLHEYTLIRHEPYFYIYELE